MKLEQMIADARQREEERQRQKEEQQRQEEERRNQELMTWLRSRIIEALGEDWLALGDLRIAADGNPALAFNHEGGDYALFFSNRINNCQWIVRRGMPGDVILTENIRVWRDKQQLQDRILCAIASLAERKSLDEVPF